MGNSILGGQFEEGVKLVNAKIEGDLLYDGAHLVGSEIVPALDAYGAKIDGSVFLRHGFRAEREVNLVGAKSKEISYVTAGSSSVKTKRQL